MIKENSHPGGAIHATNSLQGRRVAVLAGSVDLEHLLMEAGYHSCFGCRHRGEKDTCQGCSVMSPHWAPNARWLAAQKAAEKEEIT